MRTPPPASSSRPLSSSRSVRLAFALVLLLAVSVACTDHSSEEGDAINVDGQSDVSADTSADVAGDQQVDTTADTTVDVPTDQACVLPEPTNHRTAPVMCDNERSDALPVGIPPDGDAPYVMCRTHEECTDGVNGRCSGNSHDGYYCTYDQCFTDTDCGGSVCECGGGFRSDHNVCMVGNCSTDADCGAGGFCSPSFGSCGNYTGVVGYWCHTCQDECVNDTDCIAQDGFGEGYCMFSEEAGHWTCSYQHCAG